MASSLDALRQAAGRLSTRQRVQIVLAAVATAGLVWAVSVYATRTRYAVLFGNLRSEDAAPVLAALKERRVPYRLEAGGSVIEVPAERVDELRLELAAEGLPRGGGVGFEIFDKPAFGVSDFVQNVNYRRALERELGRTIQSLDVVESARVHLALPPESVFAGERREPSASVVVGLKPGRSLTPNQVGAIAHLVASGVEGLDPSRVSVIDGHGRMLSDGSGAESAEALSSAQLEAKRAIEANLEARLLSILEPVVGAGRVRARATVELKLARVQKVEESYDPDSAVVRSELKTKTRRSGGGPAGVPGTASNLPAESAPVAVPAGGAAEESQSSTTNFEINKTVATIAEPPGSVSRQSVAVVVDNALQETTGAEGKPERRSVPRTEEEMRKISDLARAAAGIDEKRGDTLIVENIPFEATAATAGTGEEGGGSDRWAPILEIARQAVLPVAVILIALLIVRPALSALRGLKGGGAAAGAGPLPTVAELQARLARGELVAAGGPAADLRRRLLEAARENPEAAALVVRGWLGSSGGGT
jgi:flagellar M-ring protein FliF